MKIEARRGKGKVKKEEVPTKTTEEMSKEYISEVISAFTNQLLMHRRAETYSPYYLTDNQQAARDREYGRKYDMAIEELENLEENVDEGKVPIPKLPNRGAAKDWVHSQLSPQSSRVLEARV